MLIYELYNVFIKYGDNELFDYFAFIWFSILALIPDIISFPILIIALIMRKARTRREIGK